MPRVKQRKRPINAFFRRFGLCLITLAIIFCSVVALYVVFSMVGFDCPIKKLIGFDCPLCDMVSAAVDLFIFDFTSAFNHNPSVFVLSVWILISALRYLFKGNFKRIMSFWWCFIGIAPIFAIWAVRVFL